ncbi:MAG: type IV pili methyl-accepting chemotaxis transducer N-terminal domain-containing protein [Firmicutes bacterium]|nr:type IV pili methyl-accepting chemotaxis transducer N-terminal domain-containing protein [Bacillota bacterium]
MIRLSGVSIKWKLLIPVVIILLVTLAQLYLVVNMNRVQQEDTARVNLAGRTRMLSQKMTKETLNFIITRDPAQAQSQSATIATLENSLQALVNGGQVDLGGQRASVKPAGQAEILAALRDAGQYWQQVKPVYTAAVLQPDEAGPDRVAEINAISLQLLQRFDAVTGMFEKASAGTVRRNMLFLYAGLFFYLLVALAAWFYVQTSFIRPVLALRDAADRIAAGDLRTDLTTNRPRPGS